MTAGRETEPAPAARRRRGARAPASTADVSDRRLIGWGMLLGLSLAVAAVAGDAQAAPWWVVMLIALSFVLSDLFPVKVGGINYVGSDFAMWLSIAVLGAWPSLLIVAAAVLLDLTVRGIPLRLGLVNLAINAFLVTAGSLILEAAFALGVFTRAEPGLPIALLLLGPAMNACNLLLLKAGNTLVVPTFRAHLFPVLPWVTLTAAVAAGAVHAYYTTGPGAIAVAVAVQGAAQALLRTIERDELRAVEVAAAFAERDKYLGDALAAERRERRRLATALHDDALQTLISSGQDLASGDTARAQAGIAAATKQLRELAGQTYELEQRPASPKARVEELLRMIASPRGMTFLVEVRADPPAAVEDLVMALVRELAVNAAKHSGGSHIGVEIDGNAEEVRLVVQDDGRGFALRPEEVRDDRLGLAMLRDRVGLRGGRVEVTRTVGGGACVGVTLPVRG